MKKTLGILGVLLMLVLGASAVYADCTDCYDAANIEYWYSYGQCTAAGGGINYCNGMGFNAFCGYGESNCASCKWIADSDCYLA